jgi:hypothetical protein
MSKANILCLFLTLISIKVSAWQISPNTNSNWLMSIKAAPSVYVEMYKYFQKQQATADAQSYVEQFIPTLHTTMVQEVQTSLSSKLAKSTCTPSTQVVFPEQLTSKFNFTSKQNFESHFLKIESYACLGHLDLDRVFETLMSESFQRKAINGLKNIQLNQSNNQTCIETKIFGLGTSRYCLTKQVQKLQNQYIIQSFNEANVNNPDVPVYFKESINVINRLANGEITVYSLLYARGPDLAFRNIIKTKVEDQQAEVRKYLIEGSK